MGNLDFLDGFNASRVEPIGDMSPIPAGEYSAIICGSEIKSTKSGTGQYLALTFEILTEGNAKSRKIWANLNLRNPSAAAVEISKATLSAICRAVGVLEPRDSTQLHNKMLRIKIEHKRRKDTGDLQADIVGYHKAVADVSDDATEDTPPWLP